ncbi:hypothetical protein VSQ32_00715 [Lachnospiraceae bacterium KK002]
MTDKKEVTAPIVSVGADTEQSLQKCNSNSIILKTEKFNIFVEKGGGCNG